MEPQKPNDVIALGIGYHGTIIFLVNENGMNYVPEDARVSKQVDESGYRKVFISVEGNRNKAIIRMLGATLGDIERAIEIQKENS